ncbi:MAG: leucine--tRNA ligase [Clostridia bacterium]|nr:leucine--tRNA ligase [Clostridia bacterium]
MSFNEYNPSSIEKKWQGIWEADKAFEASADHSKLKFFGLIEFPYPSGNGLHVGHPRSNTALDIICRKRRMEGYNVLFPMGWDAFGLPTENFAIKNQIHPAIVTKQNVDHFRDQLKMLGFSFDWSREVNTTDPNYYRWTQWIFLQLFKAGLAYKSSMPINWCTSCKVGLANEEVVNGKCERCGGEVVRQVKSQWMLKITDYADKLIEGLDSVNFIEKVKIQQRNWIGKSTGAEVDFTICAPANGENPAVESKVTIYTTRPDTLFGATYMVLSPEHKLVEQLALYITNNDQVLAYKAEAARKSDFERTEMAKDKTGVELKGIYAVNPVDGRQIPVWISDYVLASYGTGAIMAVPAHDTRDYEFAKTFGIDIIEVVAGGDISKEAFTDIQEGTMINSGFLNGKTVAEAKESIIAWLEEKGIGHAKVNFKLRDWVFSRQRYWGEPIPLVYCEHCGWVPVPEDQLPLELPAIEQFVQTDDGESPLTRCTDWVNTTCPHCGQPAKRETDTMPQWAGSSWYYIRYADPHNNTALADWDEMNYWLPVDWYNGGMEHTTLHLLYSRFWHKFLYDQGVVPTAEPYAKRTAHGMILGENGEKMSKSRGNVVNPDDTVAEIGADAFRTYEMFMGAFDQPIPWSTQGARGCRKFLDRVWKLQEKMTAEEEVSAALKSKVHGLIKKVSDDYEKMKFNTAIAAMMAFINEAYTLGSVSRGDMRALLQLLNPVAPHMTEEIWEANNLGAQPIYKTAWPTYDEAAIAEAEVEIAVQILGKIKARIMVPSGLDAAGTEEFAKNHDAVKELLDGKTIVKVIAVPGRLINFIVR